LAFIITPFCRTWNRALCFGGGTFTRPNVAGGPVLFTLAFSVVLTITAFLAGAAFGFCSGIVSGTAAFFSDFSPPVFGTEKDPRRKIPELGCGLRAVAARASTRECFPFTRHTKSQIADTMPQTFGCYAFRLHRHRKWSFRGRGRYNTSPSSSGKSPFRRTMIKPHLPDTLAAFFPNTGTRNAPPPGPDIAEPGNLIPALIAGALDVVDAGFFILNANAAGFVDAAAALPPFPTPPARERRSLALRVVSRSHGASSVDRRMMRFPLASPSGRQGGKLQHRWGRVMVNRNLANCHIRQLCFEIYGNG
jgi:hypothetical protein